VAHRKMPYRRPAWKVRFVTSPRKPRENGIATADVWTLLNCLQIMHHLDCGAFRQPKSGHFRRAKLKKIPIIAANICKYLHKFTRAAVAWSADHECAVRTRLSVYLLGKWEQLVVDSLCSIYLLSPMGQLCGTIALDRHVFTLREWLFNEP